MSRSLLVATVLALVVCSLGQLNGSCTYYCNTIFNTTFLTACTAGSNQPDFDTNADCMSWCALVNNGTLIQNGTDQDTNVQTLGCRIYYANLVIAAGGTTWTQNCDNAAMTGGGVCGTRCNSYCISETSGACAGGYPSGPSSSALNTCTQACQYMPSTLTVGHDITANAVANWQNSVQCRTYHGGAPAIAATATHCPHAWVTGGINVCGPPNDYCTGFCQLYTGFCSGGNLESGVTGMASCVSLCNQTFPYSTTTPAYAPKGYLVPAPAGNTIDCRSYHVLNAIGIGPVSTHCQHAWIINAATSPCYGGTPTPSNTFTHGPVLVLLAMGFLLLILQ